MGVLVLCKAAASANTWPLLLWIFCGFGVLLPLCANEKVSPVIRACMRSARLLRASGPSVTRMFLLFVVSPLVLLHVAGLSRRVSIACICGEEFHARLSFYFWPHRLSGWFCRGFIHGAKQEMGWTGYFGRLWGKARDALDRIFR